MSRNFDTLNDVYAVLLGVINKQEAKITRAQFNSRLEILSLDKISKNDFKLIVDEVKSSPNLKDIFEKASYGVYTMKDLELDQKDSIKEEHIVDEESNTGSVIVKKSSDGNYSSERELLLADDELQDEDALLRYHGYDPEKWEIKTSTNAKNSRETNQGTKHTYNSRVTVSPRRVKEIDIAINTLKNTVAPIRVKNINKGSTNLVLPQPDVHFGITTIEDIDKHVQNISRVMSKGYDIIVIEQLGDLFHSSQMQASQTLKGTLLDEVNMVDAVEDAKTYFDFLITNAIKNSNKVIVKQMAGNHSGNLEYMFMEYLKAKYPQIEVDNNIKYRYAYLLGHVGIMLAHGDYAQKDLPMLFANEYKEVWSLSENRFIHKGHYHKEKTVDDGGVLSQQFGTLKPNDKYEISNGWTLSKKTMYALEYSDTDLITEYYV